MSSVAGRGVRAVTAVPWVVTGVLLSALVAPSSAAAQEIEGTAEADELNGTQGDDTIAAYGGDDDVRGWGGDDLVLAGTGADTAHGGKGRDELRGGDGPDRLVGGINYDVLIGDEGDDELFGRGAGAHFGSAGDDTITIAYPRGERTKVRCGAGEDTAIFNEAYDDVDLKGCETVTIVSAG